MKIKIIILMILIIFTFTACPGTTKDFTKTQTAIDELKNNPELDCQKDNIKSVEDLYTEAIELEKAGKSDESDIKIQVANELMKTIKEKGCPEKEKKENTEENNDTTTESSDIDPEFTTISDPANENISLKIVSNYTPETIYFAFNSYQVSEDSKKVLLKHLDFLLKNPQVNIKLGGHTDSRGSEEYNLILGEKRVLVIRDFFTNQGIKAERIETTSYGEELLADTSNTEEAHAKNRRVEFKFILSE